MEAGHAAADSSSVRRLVGGTQQWSQQQQHGAGDFTTAAAAAGGEGSLLISGVAFAELDAGLGHRSAVHVMEGVMMTPRIQQLIGSFRSAAKEAGFEAAPGPAKNAAGTGRGWRMRGLLAAAGSAAVFLAL